MRFKISSAVESVGDAVAGRKFSKIYIDHTVGSKKTNSATTISVHSIFYVWRDIQVYLSESSCPSLGSTLQGILASCPGRSVALGSLGSGRGTKKC